MLSFDKNTGFHFLALQRPDSESKPFKCRACHGLRNTDSSFSHSELVSYIPDSLNDTEVFGFNPEMVQLESLQEH